MTIMNLFMTFAMDTGLIGYPVDQVPGEIGVNVVKMNFIHDKITTYLAFSPISVEGVGTIEIEFEVVEF